MATSPENTQSLRGPKFRSLRIQAIGLPICRVVNFVRGEVNDVFAANVHKANTVKISIK